MDLIPVVTLFLGALINEARHYFRERRSAQRGVGPALATLTTAHNEIMAIEAFLIFAEKSPAIEELYLRDAIPHYLRVLREQLDPEIRQAIRDVGTVDPVAASGLLTTVDRLALQLRPETQVLVGSRREAVAQARRAFERAIRALVTDAGRDARRRIEEGLSRTQEFLASVEGTTGEDQT